MIDLVGRLRRILTITERLPGGIHTLGDIRIAQDDQMDLARKNLDWEGMIKHSIDPDLSKKIHFRNGDLDDDVCSMCGEFCAIKILKDALEKKSSKKII